MIPNLILNVLSIKLIVSIRIGVFADVLLMALHRLAAKASAVLFKFIVEYIVSCYICTVEG